MIEWLEEEKNSGYISKILSISQNLDCKTNTKSDNPKLYRKKPEHIRYYSTPEHFKIKHES